MIIRACAIRNFRSLKKVNIRKFNPITLLHGDNDVGKSNVLNALELIFESKEHSTTIASASGRKEEKHVLGFWAGPIQEFTDNFYRDSSEPINFSVTVRFDPDELKGIIENEEFAGKICKAAGNPDNLEISGQITRDGQNRVYQKLLKVLLNNKTAYEENSEGDSTYFSTLEDYSENERYIAFEKIMSTLNNLFTLVSSRRYLTTEEDFKGRECVLDPTSFKNWLFNLQMNRDTYVEYEEIRKLFSEPPFNFGEMSFARDKNNIEILVKRNDLRLPIGRLGTGVQQILYLLANIVHNKGKVLGIEEMEINLSERSQNSLLGMLDDLIKSKTSTIRQVIISSHSYDYGRKGQVLRWWVSHDGNETNIKEWDNDAEAVLMDIRIGRLIGRLSDKEMREVFLKASSTSDLKEIITRVFTKEEISKISEG